MKTTQCKDIYATNCSIQSGADRAMLFLDTFNKELDNAITSNPSLPLHTVAAILRQRERSPKRVIGHEGWSTMRKAVDNFVEVNGQCGNITPDLPSDICADAREFIYAALSRFTAKSAESLGCLDLGYMLQLWRYGPGSSVGTTHTHFADKIQLESVTVTRGALPYARMLRSINPHLRLFDESMGERFKFKVVKGSSTSTVPKNAETDRTVSTEPLMNMALQLAAGMYIEGALRCCGLDISNQAQWNMMLAEVGSIDGSLATIDLKNASDLISMLLIKLLWPSEWFHLFMDIRSPYTKIVDETNEKSHWIELNMMSTMGNGFTFPMMTLTLLALVYAVQSRRESRRLFVDFSETAVFGDDIIVRTEDYEPLVQTLSDAGLTVNLSKSYSEGPFRESCGGDYWAGFDITPVYVTTLYNDPEIYVAINKLHCWMEKIKMYFPDTIALLLSFLDAKVPFRVPWWEAPTSGVYSIEVPPRYKSWQVNRYEKFDRQSQVDANISMLIYTSGCVESCKHGDFGRDIMFFPRRRMIKDEISNLSLPSVNAWKFTVVRRPKGFLDGADRGSRSLSQQHWIGDWFNHLTLLLDS